MNVNDYGILYAFFTAYDMSAFTGISITFTRPDKTTLTVADPAVSVPPTPLVTPGPTFPANQYAAYVFVEDDVTIAGTWTARVTYLNDGVDPPERFISNVGSFVVNP